MRRLVLMLVFVNVRGGLFDEDLHDSVLDEELCQLQVALLLNHSLDLMFLDSSGTFPTGLSAGNVLDLGDFNQCINTRITENGQNIGGKYCLVDVAIPENIIQNASDPHKVGFNNMWQFPLDADSITLGLCIPKVCKLEEAIAIFPPDLSRQNLTVRYYRILNDKPWLVLDYYALALVAFIGLLNLVSTSYDLYQTFAEKKHSARVSPLLRSFSVYSNARQFLSLQRRAGSLQCVDGLRALSMMWIIFAHTFIFSFISPTHNDNYVDYFVEHSGFLITAASFSVDTFTTLSGLFCVYCTLDRFTLNSFTKNLHWFYLHRLSRILPLLAAVLLLHVSLLNHVADGPVWGNVNAIIQPCRDHWWATLLHVQNYINGNEYCIPQSWFLSSDVQLYMLCPLALVFLFGPRRRACLALLASLAFALLISSIYNFYDYIFLHGVSSCNDWKTDLSILERNPMFCVGMIYGYSLHHLKGKTIKINQYVVMLLWCLAAVALMTIPFTTATAAHVRAFDKTWYDHFVNAYMRPVWALAVGWVVLACAHGYGGPVNWFLSLKVWKVPSRLSYAMYLTHNLISVVNNATWYKSRNFSISGELHQYLSDLTLSALISLLLCILLDEPLVMLRKALVEDTRKLSKTADSTTTEND